MAALAIAAGLLIGVGLGALGGGGSILTVPALVYLLGLSPHRATTASLLVVGVAAVVGAVAHARGGRVRLKTGAMFGALGVAGSYAGSLVSATVPANLLLAGFGLLMLTVAALMLLRRPGRTQPASGPVVRGASSWSRRRRPGSGWSPGSSASAGALWWCRPWCWCSASTWPPRPGLPWW